MRILEGLHGHHVNRTATGIHLVDERVVAQTGRDRPVGQVRRFRIEIFLADHLLQFGEPLGLVLFAEAVLRVGLQVQEVGARPDRSRP